MILDVFDDTLTLDSIFCRFTEQNYNILCNFVNGLPVVNSFISCLLFLKVFDDTLTLDSIFCRFTEQNYNNIH